MPERIELRRDTAANWTTANPILYLGEPAVETDTHLFKIGDGTSAYADLQYEEAIDASFVISGVLALARIPTMDAAHIPTLDAAKIGTGTLNTARIPNLDAAKISSGVLDVSHIPSLNATQTNAGVFDTARIPTLDAAKIGSGTLDVARIPSLPTSQITSGTFASSYIPALDAAKITTGVFNLGRIPDLSAAYVPIDASASVPKFATATATSATAGTHGAVPAQVLGYIEVLIGSTPARVPYFDV